MSTIKRAPYVASVHRASERHAKELRLKQLLADPDITRTALLIRLGMSHNGLKVMAKRLGLALPKEVDR